LEVIPRKRLLSGHINISTTPIKDLKTKNVVATT
jgi:hypothetical protein